MFIRLMCCGLLLLLQPGCVDGIALDAETRALAVPLTTTECNNGVCRECGVTIRRSSARATCTWRF